MQITLNSLYDFIIPEEDLLLEEMQQMLNKFNLR